MSKDGNLAGSARITLKGTHRCACGKSAYPTRKLARRSARVNAPEGGVQVYLCERDPRVPAWHFGHPKGAK